MCTGTEQAVDAPLGELKVLEDCSILVAGEWMSKAVLAPGVLTHAVCLALQFPGG